MPALLLIGEIRKKEAKEGKLVLSIKEKPETEERDYELDLSGSRHATEIERTADFVVGFLKCPIERNYDLRFLRKDDLGENRREKLKEFISKQSADYRRNFCKLVLDGELQVSGYTGICRLIRGDLQYQEEILEPAVES